MYPLIFGQIGGFDQYIIFIVQRELVFTEFNCILRYFYDYMMTTRVLQCAHTYTRTFEISSLRHCDYFIRDLHDFITNVIIIVIFQIKTTPVVTNLFKGIYEDVKQSYTNHTVLRWSFWHVLGMTSNVQVITISDLLLFIIDTYLGQV